MVAQLICIEGGMHDLGVPNLKILQRDLVVYKGNARKWCSQVKKKYVIVLNKSVMLGWAILIAVASCLQAVGCGLGRPAGLLLSISCGSL